MFDSGIFKSEDHLPLTVAFALLVVSVAAQWRSSKLHSAAIDDLQNQLEEAESSKLRVSEALHQLQAVTQVQREERDQQRERDKAKSAKILRQAKAAILEKHVELNGLRKDLEEVLRDQQCDEAEAAEILRQANEAILEKNVELNGLRKDLEEVLCDQQCDEAEAAKALSDKDERIARLEEVRAEEEAFHSELRKELRDLQAGRARWHRNTHRLAAYVF